MSSQLQAEVIYFLTEKHSCAFMYHIFQSGESVELLEEMGEVTIKSKLHRFSKAEFDIDEFDVKQHLGDYLASRNAYVPWLGFEESPEQGPGVKATVEGLVDEDFERVDYLAFA